jgi:hypothetical protein
MSKKIFHIKVNCDQHIVAENEEEAKKEFWEGLYNEKETRDFITSSMSIEEVFISKIDIIDLYKGRIYRE